MGLSPQSWHIAAEAPNWELPRHVCAAGGKERGTEDSLAERKQKPIVFVSDRAHANKEIQHEGIRGEVKKKPKRKLLEPEEETEDEKHFRAIYQQISGDDMQVCANELKIILKNVLSKHNIQSDGFSQETCRSMIALMDTDGSGKLNLQEFKHLWKKIKMWQIIFKNYDKNNSSSISSFDMRNAVNEADPHWQLFPAT
uniref:EF-hand domain-containing protein n=1 Tax=Knipowitschia caucasica TaxID=637954 RepID=A0AAV2KAP4_KNICA